MEQTSPVRGMVCTFWIVSPSGLPLVYLLIHESNRSSLSTLALKVALGWRIGKGDGVIENGILAGEQALRGVVLAHETQKKS